MLTPSGTLQDWIDNQNAQMRGESDIVMRFFNRSNGVCSSVVQIDRNNIETFSIKESGSVLGFSTPQCDISFTLFKNGNIENLIKVGQLFWLWYKCKNKNGVWQEVFKGTFEVSKAKVQNNGLVAQYEAKIGLFGALEQIWDKGGMGETLSGYVNDCYNEIKKYDNYIRIPYSPQFFTGDVGYGEFHSGSILSTITSIGQVAKKGIRLHPYIAVDDYTYGFDFYFIDLSSSMSANQDYIIEYSNELKKPEIVEETYFDAFSLWETRAIGDMLPDYTIEETTVEVNGSGLRAGKADVDYKGLYPVYWTEGTGKMYGNYVSASNPSSYNENTVYTITYKYVRVSKKLYEGIGRNVIELDNPFCSWEDMSPYGYRPEYYPHNAYNSMNEFFTDFLTHQQHYELDVRFDPRLEVFDCITYADSPTSYRRGIVEEITMTFNGSFKGRVIMRDLGSSTRVVATFHTFAGGVGDTQELWSGETPSTTYVPTFSSNSAYYNAVYSAKVFTEWSPALAPITENTDYTPDFDPTYRIYEEINYSSMPTTTFNAQIVGWTTQSLSIGYRATPHIAHIFALKNSHPSTIPAKEGGSVAYISSFPTTFSGDVGKDEWQDNRIIITKDTTLNKWVIRNRRRLTRETLYTLAKRSNGKLYFATNDQIANLNLEIISGDTIDDLWGRFSYDASNDCFLVDSQDGGDVVRLYKEQS